MENKEKQEKKTTYEFTTTELSLMWEMLDLCLKVGGIQNLSKVNVIAAVLQKPIKEVFDKEKKQ